MHQKRAILWLLANKHERKNLQNMSAPFSQRDTENSKAVALFVVYMEGKMQ